MRVSTLNTPVGEQTPYTVATTRSYCGEEAIGAACTVDTQHTVMLNKARVSYAGNLDPMLNSLSLRINFTIFLWSDAFCLHYWADTVRCCFPISWRSAALPL
jgi:hypothetical protein